MESSKDLKPINPANTTSRRTRNGQIDFAKAEKETLKKAWSASMPAIITSPALDLLPLLPWADILNQSPFDPQAFRAWIDAGQERHKEGREGASEQRQRERRAFEFLTAVSLKTPIQTKEHALKTLQDIDAWEEKQLRPRTRAERRKEQKHEDKEKLKALKKEMADRSMRKDGKQQERRRIAEEKLAGRDENLRLTEHDAEL